MQPSRQQVSAQAAARAQEEHEVTRGMLNAALIGALCWSLLGALGWFLG
jgi:hypothetical protein